MTNKTLKNIRICCYVALVFCLVWVVAMILTFYFNMFGGYSSYQSIDWSNNTFKKVAFLVCYVVGTITVIALCIKAVANTMSGLRENNVFPRSNEKLMLWIALAELVRLFGSSNIAALWDDSIDLAIVPENLITPFFLLFFAFMYKVAADAVEENNLTI